MGTRFNLPVAVQSVTSNTHSFIVRMFNPLDPVGSFFQDLAANLRAWYASFLEVIVNIITSVATPTPEMLTTSFFSLALGGTFGLARILVALVAVVIALIIVVSPTARHGVKIQRVLTSMVMVILFGYLFYPVYGLLFDLTKALTKGAIALVTQGNGSSTVQAILSLFTNADAGSAISTIISTGLSGFFGIFIVAEVLGIWASAMLTMIFYPVGIAIRPLGEFGNRTFNMFNAMIVTTLLAPPIMAFTFMWPAYAQKYLPVIAIGASPFLAIIGSLISVATPLIIFFMAYVGWSKVFGRLDDASGKFDVGEMPPVSVEEVKNDVQVTNNLSTAAVLADVVGDSLLYGKEKGDFFDDIVKTAANLGATATTAAGHPYLGVTIKAAAGAYDKIRHHGSTDTTTEGGDPNV